MPVIVEEEYGNYRIKAGRLSGAFVARAFPKPPAKTQGLIAEATGTSEATAIDALKVMIDQRDAQWSADRRWEPRAGIAVPQEDEFREALSQSSLSGAQVALLRALALSGDDGLSSSELAHAAGYKSKETAEKVFRKAGALIADYLGIDLSGMDGKSEDGVARILAFRERVQDEAAVPVWIMHGELRASVLAVL